MDGRISYFSHFFLILKLIVGKWIPYQRNTRTVSYNINSYIRNATVKLYDSKVVDTFKYFSIISNHINWIIIQSYKHVDLLFSQLWIIFYNCFSQIWSSPVIKSFKKICGFFKTDNPKNKCSLWFDNLRHRVYFWLIFLICSN